MSTCPLISGIDLDGNIVKAECLKHDCALYINVVGVSPQTGQEINQWDCSHAWTPLLLIENSIQQRQTGAAVESLRNTVANENTKILHLAEKNKIGITG